MTKRWIKTGRFIVRFNVEFVIIAFRQTRQTLTLTVVRI